MIHLSERQLNNLYLILATLAISTSVFAQTIPALPKEWRGEISATSIGKAHNAANPDSAAMGWNKYDEVRTLIILRQEGRHLEMVLINPRGETSWIGTISKDGKQIMASYQGGGSWLLNLLGKTLSGCGVSHGNSGTFENWLSNYAVLCLDLTAVE